MKNFPNRESDDVLIIWKQFISTVENDLEIMMFLMDGDGFLSFSIYSYVERESKSPGFNSLTFSSNKRTNTFGMTLSVAQIIVEDFWSTLFLQCCFSSFAGIHFCTAHLRSQDFTQVWVWTWTGPRPVTAKRAKILTPPPPCLILDVVFYVYVHYDQTIQSPLFSLSFFVQIRIRILY